MRLITLFAVLLFFGFTTYHVSAQTDTSYWKRVMAFGLNLDQGLIHNPRVGAGLNRIGAGGIYGWQANYRRGVVAWDNNFSVALAVQRLGAGVFAEGTTERIPFTKNLDELRLSSKYGYAFGEGSPWFFAINADFLSQLLPTYTGNLLRDMGANYNKISAFMSPGFLTVGVGIDYKPSEFLSIFYSPVAYKGNYVLIDEIARTKAFTPDGQRFFHQMGQLLKARYANVYFNERFSVINQLALYSNYLREPQNIDVDLQNTFQFNIFKGLALQLLLNFWYDHDTKVQLSDYNAFGGLVLNPDGTPKLGRRVSTTQAFSIKYSVNL